ncbi:MAG: HD-GYP domain-containing protein [Armatimonadota bacterium]|nr:HD-GYP domain-containing protein [Armatimonadota bacterium]
MRDVPARWSDWLAQFYRRCIVLLALGMVAAFLWYTPPARWLPGEAVAILLFATLTELLPVPLLRGGTQVTLGFPIVCAVIAMYGTLPAMAVDGLPTLLAGLLLNRSYPLRYRWQWGTFNAAQSALSAGTAGLAYHWLAADSTDLLTLQGLLALTGAAVVYLTANGLLVSVAGSLYNGEPLSNMWRYVWRLVVSTYVLLLPLSLLLILLLRTYEVTGFILVAGPFLAARECFRQRIQQIRNYRETIRALGLLIQQAHPYTSGHLQRASQMAMSVAARLGVPARHIELLPEATALHDLGKVGVDEAILNKLTTLTEADWQAIRSHPLKGAEVVSGMKHLEPVALWIALHHERPDGKGYPFGLKMGEIPIEAHIIAVVDAFDAMVGSDSESEQRPYRQPLSVQEAIAELQKGAGTQFHPEVVQAFLDALVAGEFGEQHAEHAALALARQAAA